MSIFLNTFNLERVYAFDRLISRIIMKKFKVLSYLLILFLTISISLFGQSTIKIVAANISSGNYQKYEAPGIRIFQGIKPDICCIQEFNYDGEISDFVRTAFGTNFAYYRESYNNSGDIPNGIIYRNDFKLLDSGSWDDPEISNRGLAYIKLDVPGAGNPNLFVISVHLSTQSSKQAVTSKFLVNKICEYYKVSRVSEITDYIVLGGDFNAGSRSAQCVQTFKNAGMLVDNPIPTDQNNVPDTNASRSKEHDFVMINALLAQQQVATVLGNSTFPKGLVFDSRVYTPLSDVYPVQKSDSGATNMQHMAIIRSFLLPINFQEEFEEIK